MTDTNPTAHQHQAQRIAELEAERDRLQHEHHLVRADAQARVDAAVVRALAAERERDELRARLAELERQGPVAFREHITGRLAAEGDEHRDRFPMAYAPLYARPVPAIPADPGMLTVSMAPSSAYAMGWNDCRAKMLAAAPEAAR